jgi:hypothetical protein
MAAQARNISALALLSADVIQATEIKNDAKQIAVLAASAIIRRWRVGSLERACHWRHPVGGGPGITKVQKGARR